MVPDATATARASPCCQIPRGRPRLNLDPSQPNTSPQFGAMSSREAARTNPASNNDGKGAGARVKVAPSTSSAAVVVGSGSVTSKTSLSTLRRGRIAPSWRSSANPSKDAQTFNRKRAAATRHPHSSVTRAAVWKTWLQSWHSATRQMKQRPLARCRLPPSKHPTHRTSEPSASSAKSWRSSLLRRTR